MKQAIYDSFGAPGKHVDSSIRVRRWDLGLAYGALGSAIGFFPIARWGMGWHDTFRALSLDPAFYSRIDNLQWASDWTTLAVATTTGLIAGGGLAYAGLIPRSNQWVVSGVRLLEGKDARKEARRRSPPLKDRLTDPFGLPLHPDLWLAKKTLSRHMLIYGSVGSGKTQILLAMLQPLMANERAKLFLYDVKGDFTAKFPMAKICSPFDKRSLTWWVARDVRTSTQAAAFADSLIPEDSGSGKFWTQAARQILLGVVRSLQNEKPEQWTWTDLAQRVSMRAAEMAPILDKSYRKAYGLISNTEGQTAFNVIATLNGYTKVIDDLARAWPNYNTALNGAGTKDKIEGVPLAYVGKPIKPTKANYPKEEDWKRASKQYQEQNKARQAWHADFTRRRHVFSVTDWAADNYKGPTKIIVQSGPDAGLTSAYIAALINVAVPAIISPALPDNEGGRFLGFFLDELASIGKIENISSLIDKGRSKGCVCVLATQDLAQLRMPHLYGEHMVKALQSMVGTHIVCQLQMGETREELSKLLGTQKVARLDNHPDARLNNEGQPVVYPAQLTDMLGFRKTRKAPFFEIRALVQQGGDLLLLNFPGQPLKDWRKGQEPAAWTTRAAGFEKPRDDLTGEAVLAGKEMGEQLDQGELDRLFR